MMVKARAVISIGHVSNELTINYDDYSKATKAWLMLSSMGIPAALDAGLDGWLPNNMTTAWRKEFPMDFSLVPDLSIDTTDIGDKRITSVCMQCEVTSTHDKLFSTIHSIISEWRDCEGCLDSEADYYAELERGYASDRI